MRITRKVQALVRRGCFLCKRREMKWKERENATNVAHFFWYFSLLHLFEKRFVGRVLRNGCISLNLSACRWNRNRELPSSHIRGRAWFRAKLTFLSDGVAFRGILKETGTANYLWEAHDDEWHGCQFCLQRPRYGTKSATVAVPDT